MNRLLFQVAFLTGQSRPSSAALSPVQAAFLAALPVPGTGGGRCGQNFPYPEVTTATAGNDRHAPTPLLLASVRNGAQYWRSRRPDFGPRHRPAVEALLARADHTLFLAGSCGLEMFNNLGLSPATLDRVSVFAYGPVARRRPSGCRACFLVQGAGDWLSRWYFPVVDARVRAGGGHLGYLTDPAVRALAAAMVQRLTSTVGTTSR